MALRALTQPTAGSEEGLAMRDTATALLSQPKTCHGGLPTCTAGHCCSATSSREYSLPVGDGVVFVSSLVKNCRYKFACRQYIQGSFCVTVHVRTNQQHDRTHVAPPA